MAYQMHIGFDNNCRLIKNIYYFEYKGIRYKLIQNNSKKWLNVLITIIPGFNNTKAIKEAFLTAAEFLSAFCYDKNARVSVSYLGGQGVPDNFKLRSAKCRVFSGRKTPSTGEILGYSLSEIPKIENEDQRNALILYREAMGSNSNYLSFLFYWQILEINNKNPDNWINKSFYKKNRTIRFSQNDLNQIKLNDKKLGEYFRDDCRNAIAHIINRKPGKTKIILDTPEDNIRIAVSTRVIKEFAHTYIKEVLGLNKYLCLKKNYKDKFPVFTDN